MLILFMAEDRSLIVADPRRCEPKKFGGLALPRSPSKDGSFFVRVCVSAFPQVQSCRRPLSPRPLPEILPMSAAERCHMGHGANGQNVRTATACIGCIACAVSFRAC